LYPMEMYRSKPISHYFRAVYFHPKYHCILWQQCTGPNPFHAISGLYIFIQGTPLYPMEMFRSEPISLYFRAVYFHPSYTIVSYGNVQVRTHFTLFQGCIFSSKVQCGHTACGPNFTTTEPSRRPSWNLASVNSYFVPGLTFCQSI